MVEVDWAEEGLASLPSSLVSSQLSQLSYKRTRAPLRQFELNQWTREVLVSLGKSWVQNSTDPSTKFSRRVQNAKWRLWYLEKRNREAKERITRTQEAQRYRGKLVRRSKRKDQSQAYLADGSIHSGRSFFLDSSNLLSEDSDSDSSEYEHHIPSAMPINIGGARNAESTQQGVLLYPISFKRKEFEPHTRFPKHTWICPYALQERNKAAKNLLKDTVRSLSGHFWVREISQDPLQSSSPRQRKRYMILTDNFVFEFISRRDAAPVSFVPLMDTSVEVSSRGALVLSLPEERKGKHITRVASICAKVPRGDEELRYAAQNGSPGTWTDAVRQTGSQRPTPSHARRVVELVPAIDGNRHAISKRWMSRIQANAKVSVEDLYELDPNNDASFLGSGRYAKVHHVTRRSDGASSAIKIIDKDVFWELVSLGKERPDALAREISTHAYLTSHTSDRFPCSGVVPLRRIFETPSVLIVEMDLMSRSNLFQVVVAQPGGRFSEKRTADVVIGLINIIRNLSYHGVAHRDLKLSNLVLQPGLDERFKFLTSEEIRSSLQLIDFGMAAYIHQGGSLRGRCGTPGYVAPEILKAKPGETYSSAVDMFSLGVIAYTLLSGYEPFQRHDLAETLRANRLCEFIFYDNPWSRISNDAKDFVCKLLTTDPASRMSPECALQHPWLLKRITPSTQSSSRKLTRKHSVRSQVQPISSQSNCVIS